VPDELPKADRSLDVVRGYEDWIWPYIPDQLGNELSVIGEKLGSRALALYWNLYFETHDSDDECVSAAVPGKEGYVFHRRLEWDMGYAPRFEFREIAPGRYVRHTPRFVGALSGYTPNWHIAMNGAPDPLSCGVSALTHRQPLAWILRRAIAEAKGFDATVDWLLRQKPMRGAFVLIVSKNQACWIDMESEDTTIIHKAEYPEELVVVDDYKPRAMDNFGWDGCTDAPYKATETRDWVLDQYIKPVG